MWALHYPAINDRCSVIINPKSPAIIKIFEVKNVAPSFWHYQIALPFCAPKGPIYWAWPRPRVIHVKVLMEGDVRIKTVKNQTRERSPLPLNRSSNLIGGGGSVIVIGTYYAIRVKAARRTNLASQNVDKANVVIGDTIQTFDLVSRMTS